MNWRQNVDLWLSVDGVQLEARCWGPPPEQAPTLVLLHEGLGSISLWRDFPEKLAKATGMGVFAYSRQGYGNSDSAKLPRPIDYMQIEAHTVLPAVLHQIGFQCGVLLGHSDGASIAAVYAGGFACEGLKGICLLAPHFFTEPVGLASIAQSKRDYEDTDLKSKLARHHKDPENTFLGWNEAWLNPGFAQWNIQGHLPEIRVPVLGIQGVDDQYGTLAQLDALEAGLDTLLTRLELSDCKHSPHLERPKETLEAIVRFAKKCGFG